LGWSFFKSGKTPLVNEGGHQPDGDYHLVPVKFYNANVGTSVKYKKEWTVVERDADDNATIISMEITPRVE